MLSRKNTKTDYDKQLDRNIKAIQRSIANLRKMKLRIHIAKDIETMMGTVVDHIYVIDRTIGRIVLQKHLFTIEAEDRDQLAIMIVRK